MQFGRGEVRRWWASQNGTPQHLLLEVIEHFKAMDHKRAGIWLSINAEFTSIPVYIVRVPGPDTQGYLRFV